MDADTGPLRILMTADTVGGVWQFAMELGGALTRRGDRVLLAAMGREPSGEQRHAASCAGVDLQARPYRLVWMQEPWEDLEAAGAWLQTLADDFAPDVVHLNDFAHGDLDWPAPVLITAHSCVSSWWQAVHGTAPPPEWNRYRACVRRGLRGADEVVAPTKAMLEAIDAHHGPLPAACVIPNGRTLPETPPATKEPLVLSAGRLWDEAKNLRALTAVAPRLSWPVFVAGETRPPRCAIETRLPHVTPLGPLPETVLREWMSRASIYALPARYEPFGLSVLEAAQHGCALVLGDIPSLREVWGDAALYVPPEDHAALEAALLRLIEDAELRRQLASRAQSRAMRYRPGAMARAYRSRYLHLLERRDSASVRHLLQPPLEAGRSR